MDRFSKFLLVCLVAALALAVLAPLITYAYLKNSYRADIDSYRNLIVALKQQVDSLTEENRQLSEEKSQLTNLTQPYLITSLGWYLHKSNDPVISSRNSFTIYGKIYNIGNLQANNVELRVKFYGNNTLLQNSTVHVGVIQSITNSTSPFDMIRKEIACSVADAVTNVDISLHY